MDPSTHLKTLKNLAPTSDVTLAQKQLARIRNKKHEEDIARKDREQKRRKLLLNEKKMQEEQETNNTEINILENISKLSKQERRIAEQYFYNNID